MAFVRPYESFDHADVYDVCVRTADGGGDARGLYSDDDLMPDVFAGPYLLLEPELAFVLDDGDRAVGYVLGTSDTRRWAAEHRRRWLPIVAIRYPASATPGAPAVPDASVHRGTPAMREEQLVDLLHHPERNVLDALAAYPAHLHIDLLPEHQRAGHGRVLVRTFLTELRSRGIRGAHVGVSPTSTGARAFYERLGFHEELAADDVTYLAITTDARV